MKNLRDRTTLQDYIIAAAVVIGTIALLYLIIN